MTKPQIDIEYEFENSDYGGCGIDTWVVSGVVQGTYRKFITYVEDDAKFLQRLLEGIPDN